MNKTFYAVAVTTNLQCTAGRYEELLETSNSHNNLWAWRGDRCSGQTAILSFEKDITSLSVAMTEFSRSDGETLPADCAQCVFIRETKAFVGNGKKDDKSRESFPDILWSDEPVYLKAKSVQSVWINFDIPEEAKSGQYTGKIVIKNNDNGEVEEIPYSVQVLALTMPKPEDYLFDIELWQYPYRVAQYYGVEPFSKEHMEILKQHMLLYKNMGGHAITVSIVEEPWNGQTYGEYPSMIKWTKKAGGVFEFDFTDFDKWVGLCVDLGIADKIVCYSMIPWGNKITYLDEKKGKMKSISPKPGKRKYKKVWKQFLKALIKHTEEKGWFERICISVDERSKMKKTYDLIDSVKNSEGKVFKKSAAMNHFGSKFFPLIDRMESISVGSQPLKKAIEDYKALCIKRGDNPDLKTTMYTCVGHFPNSFTYSLPAESYWTIFFAASLGANGFLRWAYDAWVENPLEDTTHVSFESGDCFLVYPDLPDAEHPKTHMSVRLEKLWQGIRDVNKLLYLSRQSAELCEKAHRILKSVRYDYGQTRKKAGVADEKTRREMPIDMDCIRNALYTLSTDFLEFMT